MSTPSNKLTYIEWEDHCSPTSPWSYTSDIDNKPVLIQTIGWIISEDKNYLTIAASHHSDFKRIGDATTIIKSCIRKRKTINV